MPYGCSHMKPFPSFWNLAQSKIFIMQMCIPFYNTPFCSLLAKIYKMKMQRGQHIPDTVFLWTPSDTRGYTGATEGKMIKENSVPLFKLTSILCLAICLAATESVMLWPQMDYVTPSALRCKLPLAYTADLTVHNDNPNSYKQLCSCIRTSEVTTAWTWTPPSPYLGGYYS